MSPTAWGAFAGLIGGLGLVLVAWRVRAMRPRLPDRIAPYLRERPATSGLLAEPRTHTPFPTLESLLAPVMSDAGRVLERLGSTTQNVRRRIALSGAPLTVEQFRLEQMMWAVLGLTGGLLLVTLAGVARGLNVLAGTGVVVIAAVVAAVARDRWLTRTANRNQHAMLEELPAVAELLALAVSAGEGPMAALERVARTTRGALTTQLEVTLGEARAGTPLAVSLERLAARTSQPAVARFAEGIAVAVDRGTPLAEVLRAQAQDAREAARRELMEVGGKKEIEMMFPVVFLVLPVTVLFALFPGLMLLQVGL
ncbi:tight adherence protein C [Georgenia satyanarayanai]|uniref:Tight adherence protein C n=1 Tax=Georgenia satyanarayanai TaxID=860221 RepID=A0A2Y9A5T2_9MICO|nr:type II secretion system F family protein [Georgenia satyanarayanai]PYG00440.1 tight adherence protein C [Georgenia satyanarayanai]SSA39821.1 tight adherence protein C [Georgenia satyanarayanai]